MIDPKQLAQYALLLLRQVEKLTAVERLEVIGLAGALAQIEVNREIRARQDPGFVVQDE
jgi:hypothetical protein